MNLNKAQAAAVQAARAVGALMRRELHNSKRANVVTQHDIKLELDVRSQALIEKTLKRGFPQVAVLGEEGVAGDAEAECRWVVDPIDGTVNFAYGIPHACVSIALQQRAPSAQKPTTGTATRRSWASSTTLSATSYGRLFVAGLRGLNGQIIHVSQRRKLNEAIVSIGFAKSEEYINSTMPYFNKLVHRVRKMRMMGAAALGLAYVASGRFDAYIERGIRLWDIAAGGLIIECAGGEFWQSPSPARTPTG